MKYFSKKIKNEYGEFDSKAEFERYLNLKHQEDIGVISNLQRQVKFEIIPKLTKQIKVELKTKTKIVERVDEMAAHYTCDFTYTNHLGQYVIAEQKSIGSAMARDYPLRKKLIKHLIHKHNQEVGFEDWVFEEYIQNGKKKTLRRKTNTKL